MAIVINIESQVSQTITDGVTDKAPSENAVFDALANKANTSQLAGLVPYTGAVANVDLGTHKLTAKDLVVNHTSGSGDAATITKGGSGEALKVVKSSGSGNAASITGGVTLLSELDLQTPLADSEIASAATWNAKIAGAKIEVDSDFSPCLVYPIMAYGKGTATANTTGSQAFKKAFTIVGSDVGLWISPTVTSGGDGTRGNPFPLSIIRTNVNTYFNLLGGNYTELLNLRSSDAGTNGGATLKVLRAFGTVNFRNAFDDITTLTFSSYSVGGEVGVWSTTTNVSNKPIITITDNTMRDGEGQNRPLVKYTSLALLNTNIYGSGWFQSGTTLYVKYANLDVNTIKGRLEIFTGDASTRHFVYGAKIVYEGDFRFRGVYPYTLPLGANIPWVCVENKGVHKALNIPTISYCFNFGVDANGGHFYTDGWAHSNTADNYHALNSGIYPCYFVMYGEWKSTDAGIHSQNASSTNNTMNGVAGHGVSYMVGINGEVANNYGPDIVDSGTGKSIYVGTQVRSEIPLSGNSYSFYANGVQMKLLFCEANGAYNADLKTTGVGIIEYFSTSFVTQEGSNITEIQTGIYQ
jgi:hypothetical protein